MGVAYDAHFGSAAWRGARITNPQIAPAMAPPRWPPTEMPGDREGDDQVEDQDRADAGLEDVDPAAVQADSSGGHQPEHRTRGAAGESVGLQQQRSERARQQAGEVQQPKRTRPMAGSRSWPSWNSNSMFMPMWKMLKCRKPDVTKR